MRIVVYLILSYLIGAIPFAYIISKVFKNIDIRKHGSGNPGATNVYRTVSKPLGILTFVCDALKGFVPVFFVTLINPSSYLIVLLVALVTILGHIYTVFLNFKGGKGVATGFGIFLAINPIATLICLAVFAIILALSKYVALASIFAAITLPISLFLLDATKEVLFFSIFIAGIVIFRHISNIKRILNGTENKIFGK
jgi:glycerol-3-phosphate acyltransferase PlsY